MTANGRAALDAFAAEVGPSGPVTCVGGRTGWSIGGAVVAGAREVRAPVGVIEHEPAEMTVRVRAGTTVDELTAALAERGQRVLLPGGAAGDGATVGGALAVGRSDVRRLAYGHLRDVVLEVRYISAEGRVVKAGGPTVKNVSGFDLCRLLVGSLGTLGLIGEVVLRTRPLPETSQWFADTGGDREADPFALLDQLYRPAAVLWDGRHEWVLLEGRAVDVRDQAVVLAAAGLHEVDGPPPLPSQPTAMAPSALRSLRSATTPFVAEVGVGTVHRAERPEAVAPDPAMLTVQRRVKHELDPTGRLNPGRDPLAA